MPLTYSLSLSDDQAGDRTLAVTFPADTVYALIVWTLNSDNQTPGGTPTFNGSSSGVTDLGHSFGSDWSCCGMWEKDNPPTGSYNVVVPNSTGRPMSCCVLAFNTKTARGTFATANGDSVNGNFDESGTVVGAAGDIVVSAHSDDTGDAGSLISRSGTNIYESIIGGGDGNCGAQYETAAGTNTVARFTFSDSTTTNAWAWCGVAVRSPSGPPPPPAPPIVVGAPIYLIR